VLVGRRMRRKKRQRERREERGGKEKEGREGKEKKREALWGIFPQGWSSTPYWLCCTGILKLLGAIKGTFKGQLLNFFFTLCGGGYYFV
jgi:hypothetical protein